MTSHKPSEPSPTDFGNAAKTSQQAGIADESAAYEQAGEQDGGEADKATPTEESSAHPS
jgi:hypothetical protein